jgi:hypothetical protein
MAHITIVLDTIDPADDEFIARLFGATPATPAPKVTKATKAAPKVTEPADPTPEPAEDLIAPAPGPVAADLREQAVHKATELVTTGQSQKVRDALASQSAKRVSDLTDGQLEAFLAALV